MLGSYGPHPNGEAYTKNFEPEESPSGLLARSGSYSVRSRVIDDDGEVYAGKLFLQTLIATVRSCLLSRLGMVFQAQQRMVIAGHYVSVPLGSFLICTIFCALFH